MADESGIANWKWVEGKGLEIQGGSISTQSESSAPEKEPAYYYVEKILRKKVVDRVIYYRVKWIGYPSSKNTWEPIESFSKSCLNLVKEFDKQESSKRTKKGRQQKRSDSNPRSKATEKVGASHLEAKEDSLKYPLIEMEENGFNPNQLDTMVDVFAANAFGPMFRQSWKDTEVPFAIIYSVLFENIYLYVVRLQPEEETEVLMDPCKDANSGNTVIVTAANFVKWFPDLVVQYHDSKSSPNDKPEDVDLDVKESCEEGATMDVLELELEFDEGVDKSVGTVEDIRLSPQPTDEEVKNGSVEDADDEEKITEFDSQNKQAVEQELGTDLELIQLEGDENSTCIIETAAEQFQVPMTPT